MSAALIAQLIVTLGPSAIQLIEKLVAVWNKPTLTTEEVLELCKVAQTSYDEYRKQIVG